jgi:hypothetical protein
MGKIIQSRTVVGVYFEETLHQWFKDTLPGGVVEVHQSQGSGGDEVGMYWIPGISNFANIDAALVIGHTLYVFQYTTSYRHSFDQESFWQEFVAVVCEKVRFESVRVLIVSMDDVPTN